jgi:hypothetical protein
VLQNYLPDLKTLATHLAPNFHSLISSLHYPFEAERQEYDGKCVDENVNWRVYTRGLCEARYHNTRTMSVTLRATRSNASHAARQSLVSTPSPSLILVVSLANLLPLTIRTNISRTVALTASVPHCPLRICWPRLQ